MKRILLLFLFTPVALFAQDGATTITDSLEVPKYWNIGGSAGVNFNQSTLVDWAAGGASSISGATYVNIIFDYENDRTDWQNSIELGYGLIKEEDKPQRKSDDKIVLSSALSYKLSPNTKKWFWTALLDFRTQFDYGYTGDNFTNHISKFMAPGYLITSTGILWKPKKFFRMKLGPASTKMTFVHDDSLANIGAFGVDPGEKFRLEIGAILKASFDKEIFKNGHLTSNIILFSNYMDQPEKIDINWENTLVMKINNALSANIYNQLIYDYDVKFDKEEGGIVIGQEDRVQFKNILGLGLTFKFGGSRG